MRALLTFDPDSVDREQYADCDCGHSQAVHAADWYSCDECSCSSYRGD